MVFIVPPSGKIFALDVNPNTTTLHDLKVAIQQFHGIPASNQRIFLSQSLGENDSDLISNIGIGPFSTLTLHVPFFGGTPIPYVSAKKEASSAKIGKDAIAVASNGNGADEAKYEITEVKKVEEKNEENVDAAPVLDTIAVASILNGRGEGAVEVKIEQDEEKKEANGIKGIADREEVDTDSETDEANKPEGEFKLVNNKSKERFMKVFGSVGKAMSREKVENQFDTIPVTEGISDDFDAQMAAKRNARIDKWHATSFIKEKEEVKMMLERYSRKKEKKLEKKNKKKKKEQSLKNEEFKN